MFCKAEKCFASRTTCFKCGEARVPKPPGLGSTPATTQPAVTKETASATAMEVEVQESLEDLISEQEEILKFFKGKETSFARAARLAAESRLKELLYRPGCRRRRTGTPRRSSSSRNPRQR